MVVRKTSVIHLNCLLHVDIIPNEMIGMNGISFLPEFYDRMTVHRNRFLVNKPTDALNSNFIGITTLHISGSLSAHHQEF